MIEDARSFQQSEAEADIVIVGSGPAGLGVLCPLLRGRKTIIMVEAGGFRADLEAQRTHWRSDGEIASPHPPIHLYRRRAFGGTSSVWGGRCLPLDPLDLEALPTLRSESWPIAYAELAAYYPAALRLLDAGEPEFEVRDAFASQEPDAAHPALSRIERFSLPTDLGRKFREKLRRADNVRLLLHTSCVEILLGENGRLARGIRCVVAGRGLTIRAPTVVLANGGLETARLLLSSNRVLPKGLGNEHDLVGRYYMTHLRGVCGWFVSATPSMEASFGLRRTRDGIYAQRIARLPDETRKRLRLPSIAFRPTNSDAADPAHGSAALSVYHLSRSFFGSPESRRKQGSNLVLNMRHAGNLARQPVAAFAFAAQWTMAKRMARRSVPVLSMSRAPGRHPVEFDIEQLPNPQSRVLLGRERDPLGVPLLQVKWQVGSAERESAARAYEAMAESLAASAGVRLDYDREELRAAIDALQPCGGHHIGTARMGTSPRDSVLDRNLRLWATEGVHVAGSAAFPTSGSANPMLTIVALSLRLGDYLASL